MPGAKGGSGLSKKKEGSAGGGGGARAACMLSVFCRMRFFTWNECVWIDGASSGNSGARPRTSSK